MFFNAEHILPSKHVVPWGVDLPVNPPILPMLAKRVDELPAEGTPAGTYTLTITGKDANGLTQSNTAPAVSITVN